MSLNKLSIIILLISNLFSSFATDNSDDNYINKIKFRGSISFALGYYPGTQDGVSKTHYSPINYKILDYTNEDGRKIGGSGVEASLFYDYSFIFPALNFDSPLTKDNTLIIKPRFELSPVTFNTGLELILTPIAFLQFKTGFLVGPGWNIPGLALGIGKNNNGIIEDKSFKAIHFNFWVTPVFQFDLAFLLPQQYQKWTHIVLFANATFRYRLMSDSNDNTPFLYQQDRGTNMNGWYFEPDVYLGYRFTFNNDDNGENKQMLKRNNLFVRATFGVTVWWSNPGINLTHYYDSLIKDDGWGSDFVKFEFGPAGLIELPYNLFVQYYVLWQNDIAYTDESVANIYYKDRVYDDWYIYFRRFGMIVGWKF